MFTVSKHKFLERLDVLPAPIRDLAFSLEVGSVLQSIAAAHHLDKDKTGKVLALTAAVFFGFVHRTDLAREIEQGVGLDGKVAGSITEEIERKVLSRIQSELDKFYRPVLAGEETRDVKEPSEETKPRDLGTPTFLRFKDRPSITTPPSGGKGTSSAHAPFVLHEEKTLSEGIKKEPMKGFSLPFGLFRSKKEEVAPATHATIETPKNPAGEKKVVHYSEYRTNLAPGTGSEFINLETFGTTRIDTNTDAPKVVQATTAPLVVSSPEAKEMALPIKKADPTTPSFPTKLPPSAATNSPKLEGNTVDLR